MRVAFLGNQGNNAYRLCKWVREAGLDAELFMLTNRGHRSLPEQVDRELEAEGDPPWLHRREKDGFKPEQGRADLDALEASFDVVVTSGRAGLLLGPEIRRVPVVHLSLGSELTTLPHRRWSRDGKQRREARQARRALAHATRVVSGFRPSLESAVSLGLAGKLRVWGYPDDIENNRKRVDPELLEQLIKQYGHHHRVLLWLSRIHLTDSSDPVYKGADRFLRAARRAIETSGRDLRMIVGRHGDDADRFVELAGQAGLSDRIDFVPHMEYWRLLTYMSLPNAIVFDEIDPGKGELSGIAREGLSVGALVVKTIEPELIELCFGTGCPVRPADDEETCLARMQELIELPADAFAEERRSGQRWAREHLHYDRVTPGFVHVLRDAIYARSLSSSRT